MKIYVRAKNETGAKALRQHLNDTKAMTGLEALKARSVIQHKVVDEEPLTVRLKPRKAVIAAAKINPEMGLPRYKDNLVNEIHKTMSVNGASRNDYEVLER